MSVTAKPTPTMDRYAEIGDLAVAMAKAIKRLMLPLVAVLLAEFVYLIGSGKPGAVGFGAIAAGTCIILMVWADQGIGLPLVPLLAFQHLIAYALPIVIQHDVLFSYPESFTTKAGFEVLVFSLSLSLVWRFGMVAIPKSRGQCHALQGFDREGMPKLERLGFLLVGLATAYQLLQSLSLLDLLLAKLPDGSLPLVNVFVSSVTTCGLFLTSLIVGKNQMPPGRQALFWLMLAANCLVSAASFLLSSTATYVFSVMIGLFWSTGRVPWRFIAIVATVLGFLSPGKYEMRDRYWNYAGEGDATPNFNLTAMPSLYGEWVQASLDSMTGNLQVNPRSGKSKDKEDKKQSLLERINNLQNLLFVIDAVEVGHIPVLNGETYSIIPPLLLPRILWKDKPKTHEGQIKLNVHFGRQDVNATEKTYIAWGLLAEAYGNFGPYTGSIILGAVLGILCAWLEAVSANKLVLSLEGFLCFAILLGVANSFEMVASVLVTSVFQALVPIVLAATPFVEPYSRKRPPSEPAAEPT